jgi:type III secretion protein HrpB1
MNASLQRKELVWALIELTSLGITHACLEDAETVVATARALRPVIRDFDAYEAWISMKRGRWAEAIRILASLDEASPNWELSRALLAFCQFASGDSQWHISANEVLEGGTNKDALGMVRLLLNPVEEMRAAQAESDAAAASDATPAFDQSLLMQGAFMRA